MKNKSSNFWINRYEKLGHTGWRDPIFYTYDQIERLALISEELFQLNVVSDKVLDFGCGTGDFSKLLLKNGGKIWGYDLYVEPDIKHPNFKYIKNYTNIKSPDFQMDLILSVTVLDHILDDAEFKQELVNFRRVISDQGYLIMLEYAMDAPHNNNNKYQAFRTVDKWQQQLSVSGWKILSMKPIPHPLIAPSLGFSWYKNRFPVYLIGKASRFFPLNPWFLSILKKYAAESFTKHGVGNVSNSPLKLICCQPI